MCTYIPSCISHHPTVHVVKHALIYMHEIMSCVLYIVTAPDIVCTLVSKPDPPPKRKEWSGEHSTYSHHGLAVAMILLKARPLKSLAGLQYNGSRSIKLLVQ